MGMNRRHFMAGSCAASAILVVPSVCQGAMSEHANREIGESVPLAAPRYRISACDWMMLKRHTLGAIARAKECTCDGVEVDLGSLSKNPTFENKFINEPGFAEKYLESCKEHGIEISSVAMSAFYAQPFPEREIDRPLRDCIAAMKLLGVKVAFFALGSLRRFGRST